MNVIVTNVPVALGGSELDATALLSLVDAKTEVGGAVGAEFVNALRMPNEAVPKAFGTVLRSEKADCTGAVGGCEGSLRPDGSVGH